MFTQMYEYHIPLLDAGMPNCLVLDPCFVWCSFQRIIRVVVLVEVSEGLSGRDKGVGAGR